MSNKEQGAERGELRAIINQSPLDGADKLRWQQLVPQLDKEALLAILELLREDPAQLHFLTQNLVAKISAVQADDQDAWQKIVRDEIAHIDQL